MANGKPIIEITNLSKHFGKLKAVDNLSLSVSEGEVFALLGPNGAGKTTTVSMLCGLTLPTKGTATVAGFDVKKDPLKVRQQIGVVFQAPSVDDLLTGKENLEMHALLYGMPRKGLNERIDEMLALVGLTNRKDSQLKEYSGGMRKRLELARGILHRPKIMFLDEPTVGLDPQTRQHIWEYIKKMSQKEGTTVVFTTHYLEEAEQFADRVAIIDNGKVISVGKPHALVDELGGDIVVLGTKEPGKVAAKLKKLKFIKEIKVENGKVRVLLSHSHKNLPLLFKYVSGIDSIEMHPATLNDVFIKYTGREIREDAAEGGYWERMANDKHDR
ncbi:MAG: ATP-binding cassette domain-containing protein [Candidatus Micrarchaeota archaeon]|nr:ATP-binding cassette domain-containing protein [Candidatus Micrarchaeota archaeon]